jgi:hypothetical protein
MSQAVTREMMDLLGITSTLMETATISKLVQGIAESKNQAYAAVNAIMLAGKQKLEPIRQCCDWAMSALCERMLAWIAFSKKPVTLYVKGVKTELTPADIDQSHIEVECQLQPDYPQDRLQLMNFLTIAQKNRNMSRETATKMLGLDPSREEDRILVETFEDQFTQAFIKWAQGHANDIVPTEEPLPEPTQLPGPEPQPAPFGAVPTMPSEQPDMAGIPPTMGTGQPPPEELMNMQQTAQIGQGR